MSSHFLPQIQLIFHVCPAFFFVSEDEITCYSWTDISLPVIKIWPFLPATCTVPLLPLCKLLALALVTSFARPLLFFCCSIVLGLWQAGFFRTYRATLLPLHPEYNIWNILYFFIVVIIIFFIIIIITTTTIILPLIHKVFLSPAENGGLLQVSPNLHKMEQVCSCSILYYGWEAHTGGNSPWHRFKSFLLLGENISFVTALWG